MEHSELYRLLKTRWKNTELPTTTYVKNERDKAQATKRAIREEEIKVCEQIVEQISEDLWYCHVCGSKGKQVEDYKLLDEVKNNVKERLDLVDEDTKMKIEKVGYNMPQFVQEIFKLVKLLLTTKNIEQLKRRPSVAHMIKREKTEILEECETIVEEIVHELIDSEVTEHVEAREVKRIVKERLNLDEDQKVKFTRVGYTVQRFVQDIMKRILLEQKKYSATKSSSSIAYRQPATAFQTFHPEETYPPNYCYSDTSCLHEFDRRPHDSMFIEDMKTLDLKVYEMLDSIIDLEKKPIPPGTVEHDDLLVTYCQFICTTNELKDLDRKLISFERRYVVRKIMENSIIGLIRCKNKLTQIEAFNVTYTINTIISLKIPERKIQTDLPKFDSQDRAENIRRFISEVQRKLNMTEDESFDNKRSPNTDATEFMNKDKEQNTLIDMMRESLKYYNSFDYQLGMLYIFLCICTYTLYNFMRYQKHKPVNLRYYIPEAVPTLSCRYLFFISLLLGSFDLLEKSLPNFNIFIHFSGKTLFNEHRPGTMNNKRLKKHLDKPSITILEKLLYSEIYVKRILFYKDLTIDLEDETVYGFIVWLNDFLGDPSTKGKFVKSAVLIKSHWIGYRDRHRMKPMKDTYHLFHGLIKSRSPQIIQDSNDKIQEDQRAYLKLYERLYGLVTEFIESNKKYEYARGTLLEILDNWRKSLRNKNELPVFIKNFYLKLISTGPYSREQKAFVEYRDILDVIRVELRSSSYSPNKLKSKSSLLEYDSTILRAEIHKKINLIMKDNELNKLKALLLSEETTAEKENEEYNVNEEKTPTENEMGNHKNNLKKMSPAETKEFLTQKQMLEKFKKNKLREKNKIKFYYDVTPALSNVVEDVFIDLFVELMSNEPVDIALEENNRLVSKIEENDSSTDVSMKDIIKDLIKNKIIINYTETKFEDHFGTLCHGNENIILQEQEGKKKFKEPLYTSQWLIQAVKEFCVLPFFSQSTHQTNPIIKSVLLSGPPKCGKNMLVNAVCTHIGAVKFDLSAETIRKSEFFERDGVETLELYVMRAARYLHPSIFFVKEVHTAHLLSDPPEIPVNDNNILEFLAAVRKVDFPTTESEEQLENIEKQDETIEEPGENEESIEEDKGKTETSDNTFLSGMLVRLANQITKEDMILIMGISNKPFMSDMKLIEQSFNKILVFPRVDYQTARQYLSDKILSHEKVDRNFNFHELAKLCTGLPIPYMQPLIENVSNKFLFDRSRQCCNGVPRLCKCSLMKTQLSIGEFVDILIPLRHNIVSQAHEELILKWNEDSKMGKLRPGMVKKWKENIKKKNEPIISEDKINNEIAKDEKDKKK